MSAADSLGPTIDVVLAHSGGRGWGSIEHLARLAARCFGGELLLIDTPHEFGRAFKARALLPRRRGGGRSALLIAPHPINLVSALESEVLRRRYDRIAAWVIDSFWSDRIPHITRTPAFSHLYVTDPEHVADWQAASPAPVTVNMWGSDALGVPVEQLGDKPVDLQRFGRQPDAYEDDDVTAALAAARGLNFRGRPPFGADELESERNVHAALEAAKVTTAFSNRINPTGYTHPTREYVTARWVDAISRGVLVAGAAPRSQAAETLLAPGTCLEIDPEDAGAGLDAIAEAVRAWSPQQAIGRHVHALRHLDWRHRFASIARDLGAEPAPLARELELVRERIDALEAADYS